MRPAPTLVSSISARWKKSVPVGPGISVVIVTPVSLSSLRSASANDWTNDFEALSTTSYVPGINLAGTTLIRQARPPPS